MIHTADNRQMSGLNTVAGPTRRSSHPLRAAVHAGAAPVRTAGVPSGVRPGNTAVGVASSLAGRARRGWVLMVPAAAQGRYCNCW